MKLRCTENSIRIRVRKSDLDALAATGRIAESLNFGAGISFTFALAIAEINMPTAVYNKHCVEVQLPKAQAHQWINSQEVGIEHTQSTEAHSLHVLIEKDFPCKDRADEDKSDTFQELVPEGGDVC